MRLNFSLFLLASAFALTSGLIRAGPFWRKLVMESGKPTEWDNSRPTVFPPETETTDNNFDSNSNETNYINSSAVQELTTEPKIVTLRRKIEEAVLDLVCNKCLQV